MYKKEKFNFLDCSGNHVAWHFIVYNAFKPNRFISYCEKMYGIDTFEHGSLYELFLNGKNFINFWANPDVVNNFIEWFEDKVAENNLECDIDFQYEKLPTKTHDDEIEKIADLFNKMFECVDNFLEAIDELEKQ